MLTQIVVDSENAFVVPILGVTTKDSLLVQQITGLDSPDIDLFIGEYARDGGLYQGRRVSKRNVVFTFELNPNPALGETVSGWRSILYKAFNDPQADADYVKIELHDDSGKVLYCVGYTEKLESDIFSVDTLCQVSIICPDPYLRDNTETVMTHPSGWVVVTPFPYPGTAETGFQTEVRLTDDASALTLELNAPITDQGTWSSTKTYAVSDVVYSGGTWWKSLQSGNLNHTPAAGVWWAAYDYMNDPNYYKGRMRIIYPFLSGDVVQINTTRGSRSITLTRAGVTTSLASYLTVKSPWLELHSQSNTMKVYGAIPGETKAVIKEIVYTAAYWGI